MYGSHHQQPQNQGRNDEPDPFLVIEEPSMMHGIHGQHSYRPDPIEHVITSTGRCTWPALRPANKLEAMILGAGCRRRRRGGCWLGSGKGCLPSCWQRMYPGTYRASLSSLHSPTNVYTSLSSLRYCRIL